VASKPIQAAGGIVVRDGARPLVAVVQRSKDDAWVLPRGKLKRDENPVAGARREVVEETGHRVSVHEFLGAITYRARGRAKVVQFWRMQAEAEASHELMADIAAVEWLPLKAAVRRLSYPLEKLFLQNIGRQALRRRKRPARAKARKPVRVKASKKARAKAGKKQDKKARKKARPAKAKTAKHSTAHSREHHAAARRPSRQRKADTKRPRHKHALHQSEPPNSGASNRAAQERAAANRIAAMPVTAAERGFAPLAAKPADAAKRENILQRMLGRIAG
jgi:8-oxo-dGTP diphosphatase